MKTHNKGSHTIPQELPVPNPSIDEAFLDRLAGYLSGELTWAQVEGWTPEMLYYYAELGANLLKTGQFAKAQVVFAFCHEVNPKDWYFSYVLGQIAFQQGHPNLAREYLEESTSLPMCRAEPHILLALLYAAQDDERASRKALNAALEAAKRYEEYLKTGRYPVERDPAVRAEVPPTSASTNLRN